MRGKKPNWTRQEKEVTVFAIEGTMASIKAAMLARPDHPQVHAMQTDLRLLASAKGKVLKG